MKCPRWLSIAFAAVVLSSVAAHSSTGLPHEITNVAQCDTSQTTVAVCWKSVHPSTSQLVWSRDAGREAERRFPIVADPVLVTDHRVVVDGQMPYNSVTGDGASFVYPASVTQDGQLSTGDYIGIKTKPTDQQGPTVYGMRLMGPTHVFQGQDLYVQVSGVLSSGPIGEGILYVVSWDGVCNSGHDAGVYWVPVVGPGIMRRGNPDSISAHYIFNYEGDGIDAHDQTCALGDENGHYSNSVNQASMSVRIRTSSFTVPGTYVAPISTIANGVEASADWQFQVLPVMTKAPGSPATVFPPIQGYDVWASNVQTLGQKWCEDRKARDRQGDFLVTFGSWFESQDAFYDGCRNMQTVDSVFGNENTHAYWRACAQALCEPYADYVASGGTLQRYDRFSDGLDMASRRTGQPLYARAIADMNCDAYCHRLGFIDPWGLREDALMANSWLDAAGQGLPANVLLPMMIAKIKGGLDIAANQFDQHTTHSFMQGMGQDTLRKWLRYTAAQGNPDWSVFFYVKESDDAMWSKYWTEAGHYFVYNPADLPRVENDLRWTALDDLNPGFAWYYLKTGDQDSLARAQELFLHASDYPDGLSYGGKVWSQYALHSFDEANYLSGVDQSWADAEANPFQGQWPDLEPPIGFKSNCDPNFYPGCKAGTVGRTTFNPFWTTYDGSSSQVFYGTTAALGQQTPKQYGQVTFHSQFLTSLIPATRYHYRWQSCDASGNCATSADFTFTTKP